MEFEDQVLDLALRAGCEQIADLKEILHSHEQGGSSWLPDVLNAQLVEEEEFLEGLSELAGMDWWNGEGDSSPETDSIRRRFPSELAIRYHVLPAIPEEESESGEGSGRMRLATYDPFDLTRESVITRRFQEPVDWCVAPRTKILEGLQQLYGVGADTFGELLQSRLAQVSEFEVLGEETMSLDDDDEDATVLKFVNHVLREALEQRATDIHLEPLEDRFRIRFRIDGELSEVPAPENVKAIQSSVISRLKIMARLDIAEKRLPQDGRIHLKMSGKSIDVRVATIPSVEGETVCLRLLGQEKFDLEKLGLSRSLRKTIENLLALPNGIILITGPTGSGKSTSLYSFLERINTTNRKIYTIEDPVEHKIPGVVQIAVKPEIDLTFANGLRSILRGDPDVVMVGEMRDLETTEIAIRSALTGHLVFSTLHTNDALSGITRLVDVGVEPFLVSAAVRAFLAQRLVRRLCPSCREPVPQQTQRLRDLGIEAEPNAVIYAPKGCKECRGTGFRGRLAIYEMVLMTPGLVERINQSAPESELKEQAAADGFVSMREYGWEKVLAGETTLEEVLSVTRVEG